MARAARGGAAAGRGGLSRRRDPAASGGFAASLGSIEWGCRLVSRLCEGRSLERSNVYSRGDSWLSGRRLSIRTRRVHVGDLRTHERYLGSKNIPSLGGRWRAARSSGARAASAPCCGRWAKTAVRPRRLGKSKVFFCLLLLEKTRIRGRRRAIRTEQAATRRVISARAATCRGGGCGT